MNMHFILIMSTHLLLIYNLYEILSHFFYHARFRWILCLTGEESSKTKLPEAYQFLLDRGKFSGGVGEQMLLKPISETTCGADTAGLS